MPTCPPQPPQKKTLTLVTDAQVTQGFRIGAVGIINRVLGSRGTGATEEVPHLPCEVTVALLQKTRLQESHHGNLPSWE